MIGRMTFSGLEAQAADMRPRTLASKSPAEAMQVSLSFRCACYSAETCLTVEWSAAVSDMVAEQQGWRHWDTAAESAASVEWHW